MNNSRKISALMMATLVLAFVAVVIIVLIIILVRPGATTTVIVIAAVVTLVASLASGVVAILNATSFKVGERLAERLKEIFAASRERRASSSLADTPTAPKSVAPTPSSATLPASRSALLAQNQPDTPQPRSSEDYARDYRRQFCEDESINRVRIFTMTWSLNLLNIYVRLRLHQQNGPGMPDPEVLAAQDMHDPNQVFRAERRALERKVGTAIEPDQALRSYQRCVMLGDPGVGKTTMLKYLALKCAAEEWRGLSNLPIFIDLNAYAQEAQKSDEESWVSQDTIANPLLVFAAKLWEQRYLFPRQEALRYMHERLKDGNAMVLLDGLDETLVGKDSREANASYQRVTTDIYNLAEAYNSAFIVVTARFAGYQLHAPIVDFTELEVLGFRTGDIEQFVKRWFQFRQQAQAKEEQARVKDEDKSRVSIPQPGTAKDLIHLLNTPQLQALASTPLLLALIVFTYQENEGVMVRRTELYRRCVELLLREWDRDPNRKLRKHAHYFEPLDKEHLLMEVAWHFHDLGLRYFPEEGLLQVIEDYLSRESISYRALDVLGEISIESGLLKKMGEGWYGFLHLTLQEYFVAMRAIEFEGYGQLKEHLDDPWWEEVLVLYAGRTGNATNLLKDLWELGGYDSADGPNDDLNKLYHNRLILAGRCLAARPHIEDYALRMRITSRLQREMKRTRYTWTRQQLAETLASIGEQPVDDRSSGNISHESVWHKTVKELLFEMLLEQGAVGNAAQMSIGRALALYGDADMRAELVQYLYNQQAETEVQTQIVQALGLCGSSEIARQLVAILPKPSHVVPLDVRVSIAQSLGDLIDDSVVPDLVKLLADRSLPIQLRCAIIESLGASGRRSAVPDLLELRSQGHEGENRGVGLQLPIYWRVVVALASLGERIEDAYTLLDFIKNKRYQADARREIANALGTLPLGSLAREMFPLVIDEHIDRLVRISLASSMEAIGNRSLVASILEVVPDRAIDVYVRSALCHAVGKLGDRRHIELLRRLHLDHDDTYVQRNVIIARGRLGDPEVVPEYEDKKIPQLLVEWLAAPDSEELTMWVRLDILDSLGSLIGELQAPDYRVIFDLLQQPDVDLEVKINIIKLLPQLTHTAKSDKLKRESARILRKIVQGTDHQQQLVDAAHYAYWSVRQLVSDL